MMTQTFLSVLLGVGFVAAAAITGDTAPDTDAVEPASRALLLGSTTNCQWQVSNNPCINNVLNRLNFVHPSDNTKFIQCGTFGRMFIIQCPAGEIYDEATTTCIQRTAIVAQPVINTGGLGVANPCTIQNIQAGRIFFGLSADNTKFIQCDQGGNARMLTCPSQMVWDQNRQSCIFNTQAGYIVSGTLGTGAGSPTGLLTTNNPCSAQAINTNALFFSHPDPTKFIQCDLQGNAFVQQCPSGLVWNQYQETCASQLATLTLGNQNGGVFVG